MAFVGVLAAGPAVSVALAQAPATTTAPSDKQLSDQIARKFADDPALKADAVKVDVDHGVVTLSGVVANAVDKVRAAHLADVPGVTRIDNKIVTRAEASSKAKGTTGKVADKSKEAAEKTKEGAKTVGEKTKEGVSKTGEVITDTWITSRIKTKFMGDESLRASDIKVDSDDHVVTLSGSVVSAAAKTKAIADAKEVEGVKRVVDNLKIVPKP
jgi:hyperosmotically inducible protein